MSDTGMLGVLSSPNRRRIVDLLANLTAGTERETGLTASELGERLGMHPTTARFHLDLLVDSGLVEAYPLRGQVGRPRKLYRVPDARLLVEPIDEAWALLDDLLAAHRPPLESSQIDAGGEVAEDAGREWALRHPAVQDQPRPEQAHTAGAWLAKVGSAVDRLHEWGYTPDLRTENGGRTVDLTLVDCPFLALAVDHADVVCSLHRGLLAGTLEAVGEEEVDVALRPLVGPNLCLARLSTRAEFLGQSPRKTVAQTPATALNEEESSREHRGTAGGQARGRPPRRSP